MLAVTPIEYRQIQEKQGTASFPPNVAQFSTIEKLVQGILICLEKMGVGIDWFLADTEQ